MEKAKAFYSEVEHFYRNRATKFLPIANGILEKFGLEAEVQLNSSFWHTVESSFNPSDIDPSRSVFERGIRSDFLRKLLAGNPIYRYEGVLEEVAYELGLSDRTYDYYQLEGYTLIPVLFIRPKGIPVRFSDLIPVEDLHFSEFYPLRESLEESSDGWDGHIWEQFDMAICLHEGKERPLNQLPDQGSPEFEFYKALSKSVSWLINVPLLEALFELGIEKYSSKESANPGMGEVLSRRELYIEPLVVVALPKTSNDGFPSKEDVGRLVLYLRSSLSSASSIISNDRVRSIFYSGMEGIISKSLEVLFLPSREVSVEPQTNLKLKASSPEEVGLAINGVFEKFREAYEFIHLTRLVDRVEGVYSKSPMYIIQVEPFQSVFRDFSNPISYPNENPFSTFLSSLNGIVVEEVLSTYRKGILGQGAFYGKGKSRHYKETEALVNLVAVGPKSSTPKSVDEESEEGFQITYSPNELVISENPPSLLVDYLKPSLDPRFTIHTYLFPLIPALFYYGYAHILGQGFKEESKVDLSIFSSFAQKEGSPEDGEAGDGFTKAFSKRILELSENYLRDVWEGILEERHRKYLEASENFLRFVSPKDDRVSTSVLYRTYRYGDSLRSSLTFNLVVKYRQDDDFLSSLEDLAIQATLLLSEVGVGVEMGITFIY